MRLKYFKQITHTHRVIPSLKVTKLPKTVFRQKFTDYLSSLRSNVINFIAASLCEMLRCPFAQKVRSVHGLYAKRAVPKEGAHCSEVLKTSIISAGNNEGQTLKKDPRKRAWQKKILVAREGKKDKYVGKTKEREKYGEEKKEGPAERF